MDWKNPFNKKEPSQQQFVDQQQAHSINQEVLASVMHPQDYQETEAFQQNQNMLAELTRWQQDLEPMYQTVFKDLAGLQDNERGELVPIEWFKPACNVIAAKRWVDHIKTIDKNAMNGAWTIKQINDKIIWLDRTIRQDIIEHWREFGVEYSTATFTYICQTIIEAVYPTLLRGLENGERKYHGQIQKVIETKSLTPERKKTSLFGKD